MRRRAQIKIKEAKKGRMTRFHKLEAERMEREKKAKEKEEAEKNWKKNNWR